MKRLLLSVSCLGMSWLALAGEEVDRSLDVAKDAHVQIVHVNGSANVQVWDKAEVKVEGTLGDRTKKFIFEKDGNEVLIKVKVKNGSASRNSNVDEGDDLTIYVPKQSNVSYNAINANVDFEGVEGGSRIETVNGSIDAKELSGRIRLESVNGSIEADKLEGDVEIETVNGSIISRDSNGKENSYKSVNGNIDVTTESGDIQVASVNGNIDLSLGEVNQLNIETVNGTIEAHLNMQNDGELNASSVGGAIRLYFQEEVSARFDIEAHAGGKITNKLSDDKVEKAKYGPSRWLEFSHNGGSAKVNISTVNGQVQLDK